MHYGRFKAILNSEAQAIQSVPSSAQTVEQAVELISKCVGKVFTTGLGKAGYVARKAASTFCTTGTPSVFLHPGDASHGDVGAVGPGDALIAFSNSGKNREVLETVTFCKRLGQVKVIAITASSSSPLGELADIVLELGAIQEPCPLEMTPTASTAAMSAISDALALITLEIRGFTKDDFALRHHSGYLGERARGDDLK